VEAQTARLVDHFNYVLATQTFGPSYHFTAEPPVIETAGAIAALGSNTIKFQLKPTAGSDQTLAEIARGDSATKTVIDMPFANLLMWVYPLATRARLFDPATLGTEYSELYDLTRYLRQTYGGTGKAFFLGNWEMDNHLTGSRKKEPSPELLRDVTAWVATRQRAVDDAKRDTPGSDVEVYYYLEVNLYDSLLPDPEQKLPQALNYLQSQLQPKDGLSGKRVLIGEYGFPADRYSPQDQETLSRRVMRVGLEWGCPFVLYWEMYNNEVRDGRQRGFWLIDDKGLKQPVYLTLQQYFRNARVWVTDFLRQRLRLPTSMEFDGAAVRWLQ
jgi:hypothetical protein